ncbi:hypothetical protein [Amycolatopsis pigmentata]|uniref:Peptidase inhibitor family I36 n=1 Tax=Amycolatopsis pigmentata TaxID=450801 RepID=A0ABW5FVG6_9PSEU
MTATCRTSSEGDDIMYRFSRMGSSAAVALAILATVVWPAGSATAAQHIASPHAAPDPSCAGGDDWLDYAYVVDSTRGAIVDGLLCKDHVTTGDYWAVRVTDNSADSKCAHAGVIWRPASGNPVGDYGMYVCGAGTSALFTSPVRNWTLYHSTELAAFVDAGASSSAPVYVF